MNKIYLLFTFLLFTFMSIGQVPPGPGDGVEVGFIFEQNECVDSLQRVNIFKQLEENGNQLKTAGILSPLFFTDITTLFDWPLRQAEGFNYNSYYGISNFIDHNPVAPMAVLDYECLNRTYDTNSGYNHLGTDIFLWPFTWHMVENSQVEVIAAAGGIIIFKEDGNPDMNCDFSNPDWNAVYIQHPDGSVAFYGHMKKNSITSKGVGDLVEQGEYLGIVASSGFSTGPHLHFEVWENDTYTQIIDPWEGACNLTTATSRWNDQKPYRESTLNHLMTNSAEPEFFFDDCPQPANMNAKDVFLKGEQIYFTAYFHDILVGQPINVRILKPDGSQMYTSDINVLVERTAGYYFWFWNFPGNEPAGDWTFELTYEEEIFTHNFVIQEAAALPVDLISFKGNQDHQTIVLNWRTASELNSDYFEVQRSADGINFRPLGTLAGQGTSTRNYDYQFVDKNPLKGKNYYRLRQVDLDRLEDFSEVISINFENNYPELVLFPNPLTQSILQINYTGEQTEENWRISVYDAIGQMVKTFSNKKTELDLSSLENGIYLIVVANKEQTWHERILINK